MAWSFLKLSTSVGNTSRERGFIASCGNWFKCHMWTDPAPWAPCLVLHLGHGVGNIQNLPIQTLAMLQTAFWTLAGILPPKSMFSPFFLPSVPGVNEYLSLKPRSSVYGKVIFLLELQNLVRKWFFCKVGSINGADLEGRGWVLNWL